MTLTITDKQFALLMEILADYLHLVGGSDPNRKTRFNAANKLLNQWQAGNSRRG